MKALDELSNCIVLGFSKYAGFDCFPFFPISV